MRIAVSGSHIVGKTTLVGALAEALPGALVVPEPYRLLEEDGHEFAEMPSVEDFELQLERSIQSVQEGGASRIFDRCPLDILGYLNTHPDASAFQLADWWPRIQEAMATLDVVAFVPIEEPDRMAVSDSEMQLRGAVDEALRDIILDDAYGLEFDAITTTGSTAARVLQVMAVFR